MAGSERPVPRLSHTMRRVIIRHLFAAGLVTPAPKKRPKTSYIRFAADLPNEGWQADFTHGWLADGSARRDPVLGIDDHSRYACRSPRTAESPARSSSIPSVKPVSCHGVPASTLTDNGMVFTTRLAGGQRRPQRPRSRTGPARGHPDQLHPEPPDHLRQGRTFHRTLKRGLTTPAPSHHPRRATSPARHLRRRIQPSPPTPLAAAARHPRHRLRGATQSPPRPNAPTPTTASAATASTTPAASRYATPAACTTSRVANPPPCALGGDRFTVGIE